MYRKIQYDMESETFLQNCLETKQGPNMLLETEPPNCYSQLL